MSDVLLILLLAFGLVFGELVDLSWDYSNDTVYWPGVTPFKYTKVVEGDSDRGYWYAIKEFCTGEHGGTHFDAPYHFSKEGWKVADVPINRLIGQGAMIDLSDKQTNALLPEHLTDWVRENGEFENNTILLIKFGRSKYWHNKNQYFSRDSDGKMNFPGISPEAATWIVKSGKIVGVGLDTPSVDLGSSTDMMTHRILYKNQIYGLENVKLCVDLPAKGFTVVVMPMKLKDGTGAPVRVAAIPRGSF